MSFFKGNLAKTGIGILGEVCGIGNFDVNGVGDGHTQVLMPGKIPGYRGKRNIPRKFRGMLYIPGGWGGIRTPGRVAPSAVFKTVAFDRSATHPKLF